MAFIALYIVLTSLLLPETVVAVAAGTVFGLLTGSAAATTGGVLAAVVQYALARHVLRARIQHVFDAHPSLAAIQRAVAGRPLRLQVLLRVTPLNPATLSYLLGAAGVPFGGFMAAFFASIPHLLVAVYFGYAGRHVAHMVGRSGAALYMHDAAVLGGLALTITAMVFVGRAARDAVFDAVDTEAAIGARPGPAGRP